MTYTSNSLVVLASMQWMQDNGYDDKSIQHLVEFAKNNINSWINSLKSAGMTEENYIDYIAKILNL